MNKDNSQISFNQMINNSANNENENLFSDNSTDIFTKNQPETINKVTSNANIDIHTIEINSTMNNQDENNEYIVKEAELLITNYIEKIEKQDLCGNNVSTTFEKKYKNMKKITMVLAGVLLGCFWYILKF